jgi:anaerobic ribonucleoside-triphosphate reductase
MVLKDEERTKCEIWTRVCGYYRSTADFNIGKQAEYRDRKVFKESSVE